MKRKRYEELSRLSNVTELHHYRDNDYAPIRGNWSTVFGNDKPITLELACGKGEYSLALAEKYSDRNFIGIDIKGDRLWKGARQALDAGLNNVHFIRSRIDHICNYFCPEEIAEIWIVFPDPYIKKPKKRKRLTHPVFLRRYAQIMKQDGRIHLKTDSDHLFDFTLNIIEIFDLPVLQLIYNIYALPEIPELLSIRTFYENRHLENGLTIKYLCFKLNESIFRPDPPAVKQLH